MLVLVLTSTRRRAWSQRCREHLDRVLPDATVIDVLTEPRDRSVGDRVALRSVRPDASLGVAPPPYEDLVLGLGRRHGAWAALPWRLDELCAPGDGGTASGTASGTTSGTASGSAGGVADHDHVLVIDDTVLLGAGSVELVGALERAGGAALLRSGAAGAALPGFALVGAAGLDPAGLDPAAQDPAAGGGLLPRWCVASTRALAEGPDALWNELGRIGAPLVDGGRWRLAPSTVDDVDLDPDGLVDGSPVAVADLGGWDPSAPWWFAATGAVPERGIGASPGLRSLLHAEADALQRLGWSPAQQVDAPAVPGVLVDDAVRAWYRSARLADGRTPVPYRPSEVRAFVARLSEPAVAHSILADRRPDVAAAFDDPSGAHVAALRRWSWTHGLQEGAASLPLLGDLAGLPAPPVVAPRRRTRDRDLPFGVNLVGYLDGDLGLGVAARRLLSVLEAAGVPVAPVSYGRTSSRRTRREGIAEDTARYSTNLLVITPDQLPHFVADVGVGVLEGRRNIGYWFWESDVLPRSHQRSFDLVDEVWAPTRYLLRCFERYGRVPVRHVPTPLTFGDPVLDVGDRARLGLDDRFTVLFSFDHLSVAERKNPRGLVDAFRRAFGPDDGARLVLKSINGDLFPRAVAELEDLVADRDDIELWDAYLSAEDRLRLVAVADCYASLHRSEGLGLTMAEAMSVATPVVATAYSGNLDFMDDRSALLVPAREVLVGPGHFYPADGHWAEPDIDVAATHLRLLHADRAEALRIGAAGRERIAREGVAAVVDLVRRAVPPTGEPG